MPAHVGGATRLAIMVIVDRRASSQLVIQAAELIIAYRKFNDRVLGAKSRMTEQEMLDLLELVETTERSLEAIWARCSPGGTLDDVEAAFAAAIRRFDSAIVRVK
jgi:hypothetical protein